MAAIAFQLKSLLILFHSLNVWCLRVICSSIMHTQQYREMEMMLSSREWLSSTDSAVTIRGPSTEIYMDNTRQWQHFINQSNIYSAKIPSEARLSGTTAKSAFNSKIEETVPFYKGIICIQSVFSSNSNTSLGTNLMIQQHRICILIKSKLIQ